MAKLVAANLRGSHTAMFALGKASRMYLGTCVDLPHPVLPLMTMTRFFSIALVMRER